eukprot:350874-Chlamydomonas_euryale.AAC.4
MPASTCPHLTCGAACRRSKLSAAGIMRRSAPSPTSARLRRPTALLTATLSRPSWTSARTSKWRSLDSWGPSTASRRSPRRWRSLRRACTEAGLGRMQAGGIAGGAVADAALLAQDRRRLGVQGRRHLH